MHVDKLRIGYHVSSLEMGFVQKVVTHIRSQGYLGPIDVVGSRAKGSRISTKTFAGECDLSPTQARYWLGKVNGTIRKHDLSAGEVKKVIEFLPKNTPLSVRTVFNHKHPDADLDLAIREPRGNRIPPDYSDNNSGLVIEIYEPGDTSWAKTSVFDY
jgi:hypothetical protein